MGSMRRWALVIPLAAATAACGSGPGTDPGKGGGTIGTGGGHATGPAVTLVDGGSGVGGGSGSDASTCGLGVTCATADAGCGPVGDGCGGTIDCGTCTTGTTCGGGTVLGQCGTTCVPMTCAAQGATCGVTGDGCGGALECGACSDPNTICMGTPATCKPIEGDGGLSKCTPLTCAGLGATCGVTGDGCGGKLSCGLGASGVCANSNEVCLGNPPKCQLPPDNSQFCVPLSCPTSNASCGPTGDGCGNSLNCGQCGSGLICGGLPAACNTIGAGGVADGGTVPCQAKTCADFNATCGQIGDGCGHVLACPNTATGTTACPSGSTCGGGGVPYQCGAPPPGCTTPNGQPLTCGTNNCGKMPDGCGGLIDCGTCAGSAVCGGGTTTNPGVSNQCAQGTCTGLCLQQTSCPAGSDTIVTGIVYAPGHDDTKTWGTPDPLNNVLVYIPNSPVLSFTQGVACDQCGTDISGDPLVTTTTPDVPLATPPSGVTGVPAGDQLYVAGSFTLRHAPVGKNIPLVIQTGRWRRQIVIPAVTACKTTTVAASLTRLPRNKSEGDIPHMALSTGSVDALECVLRKIGVDDAEFTNPASAGRIHLFQGNDSTRSNTHTGAKNATGTPLEDVLVTSSPTVPSTTGVALANYDQVLFACQGLNQDKPTAQRAAIMDYANAGGRVYATHYNYHWIYNNPTASTGWATTGHWGTDGARPGGTSNVATGLINYQTAAPTGSAAGSATAIARVLGLANWLAEISVTSKFGSIPLQVIRNDVQGAIVPPSVDFIDLHDSTQGLVTMHYTFDTPLPPATTQCGRVLYDDFHVENASASQTYNAIFPAECSNGPMTPQEKLLEYMLFDLGSCISPSNTTCEPKTCSTQGVQCGAGSDGCGNALDCGACPTGQVCGGCGTPGLCCAPACTPQTCAASGFTCGQAGDGCGNLLDCGTCPTGEVCGGCGTPGVCCAIKCTPSTCAAQGVQCGQTPDGCGGALDCGTCPGAGEICGGCGQPGVCCTPPVPGCTTGISCAKAGVQCGPSADGCGGTWDCGTCPAGQTCGGCGVPGQCCAIACTPLTCATQGIECGPAADGCGTSVDCGACPTGQTCGGCGQPGICCSVCTPTTCSAFGAECGVIGDGCGGTIDCGTCPAEKTCGGDNIAFKCGGGIK